MHDNKLKPYRNTDVLHVCGLTIIGFIYIYIKSRLTCLQVLTNMVMD